MEINDESLIRFMAKDKVLMDKGITEEILFDSLCRAMKYMENKNSDIYKVQNAVNREKHTKTAAMIAEKEANDLIKNSLSIIK
tara:strand:- start:2 stop:250 length:249 start_codon:yes stop_codon:yes gene_type:complete